MKNKRKREKTEAAHYRKRRNMTVGDDGEWTKKLKKLE